MPAAPPAADTKKPATPAPSKAGAEPGKKAGAADKGATKAPAPAPDRKTPAAGADKAGAAAAGQQRFDRMAVRAKLVVSEPGDALEREADAVAARVMRAPAAQAVPAKDTGKVATPDRVQLAEDKKDKGAAKPAEKKEVQRKASSAPARAGEKPPAAEGNTPSAPADLIARLGHGVPLDPDARAFFEQRLGRDLSGVRIHNDEAAADAARSLQARAFTWGRHIAFASGEYQPASGAGRELLAHELAHVLQNVGAGLSHVIARKPDNPKYKDPNDIGRDAFDPAKDKDARPTLQTLKLPAIKARHADYYRKIKPLKRPAGYDRKKTDFATEQVKKWKEAIDLSAFYGGIGFVPGTQGQSLTFYGAKNQILTGTEGELVEQMKIPKWTPDGSWLGSPLQVDHIVEAQVGGIDAFDNYELLTGAHNVNVGSLLRASIYANVKGYLAATDKNTGDALVRKYLDENDVDFSKVEGGAEGKNLEKTSQFWSRQQIVGGKHLAWLKDEERAKKDDGTDKTRFALYSATGSGFIDAFPLSKNQVKVVDSGRLAGIRIQSITLSADFESATGGSVGQIKGTWDLPPSVKAHKGKTFESGLNSVAGKKYAGALAGLTPPEVDIEGASPVTFGQLDFVRGKLSADGTLTTSHPLFSGIQVPVRWRGDDFAFEHTIDATQLAGKLPIPGVTVEEAAVTLFFGTKGLGAEGSIGFTIKGFGAGILSVAITQSAKGPELTAKGRLTADRKLFDLATVEIGYSSAKGFFGSGTLGITNPDKIKGIKSAKLSAKYENSVFTATGDVNPDIPGLKAASLTVIYGKDTLQITGKLGIDNKVPGVEKADITVEVKQGDAGWKVAASGDVTPRLPGLSGSTLTFMYDDGFVLIEGEFTVKKGPLDGKVKAGVTNASVDDKGVRADKGEGRSFKVFGSADIKAEFIKDKLDGKLRLRLLPDGSVRVGGGLEVKDFEVFGKLPKSGGEFLDKTFRTPSVPIPGLGFSVGSVAVGVTFSASVTAKARASIGPGKMTGVGIDVKEFDPAHVDFDALELGGSATFQVFADAGFGIGAQINLEFSALVAKLVGSVGAEANAGLPTDKPVLTARSSFTYSAAKGLDIMNTLDVSINPELKFRLFGKVAAELNVLIDTITVWSKDWTLAEANYKLPVAINASGSLGYNTRTGLRPANPSEAIKVEEPKIDKDVMKGVVTGDTAPATVKNLDKAGKEVAPEELMCIAPQEEPLASFPEPAMSVMLEREDDRARPPPVVDEGIVHRLGTGAPMDLATRGFFEQRLRRDLSGVLIHNGLDAAREAKALQAKAFTVGTHIAFAADEYRPDTPEGRELLAHELAHVVQQEAGAARQVMRQGGDTATPAGGGASGSSPPASETQPQRIARTRRELEHFVVPASKRRHGAVYAQWLSGSALKHGPNYDRNAVAPAQISIWEGQLQGLETQPVWTQHFSRIGLSPDAPGPQPIVFRGGQISKTFDEWVDFMKRPQWNHAGAWLRHRLEVDHIVELQTAGWPNPRTGDTPENYELLDKSTNASSGGTIYIGLRQKMRAVIAAERGVPLEQIRLRPGGAGSTSYPDAQSELFRLGVEFRGIEGGSVGDRRGGGRGNDANSEFWVLAELQAGEHLAAIQAPPAATGGSGSPTEFALLSGAAGGIVIARIAASAGQEVGVTGSASRRLASVEIQRLQLDPGYGTATANANVGTLHGRWQLPPGIQPATPNVSFPLVKPQEGQFNGFIQAPSVIAAESTALSPMTFNDVGIDGAGIHATGQLRPSLPLLGEQPIDVTWMNGDIRFARTFTADDLNLSVPGISLDAASLTVFYDRDGFGAEGAVYFTLARIGTGSLTAGVDGAGRFSAEGSLDIDTSVFDEANMRVWYRDGAFGGSGRVAITRPGRIRGVNAASIEVTADSSRVAARGDVQPALPGVRNAALTASYSADEGLVVGGELQLAEIAGVREGSVHVELRKLEDGWRVTADGRAVPALPGIASEVTLRYDDGAFDGQLAVDYSRGIFSGNVTVGVTNRAVGDDGEILGEGTGDTLSIYGSGSVTARITDWLQGGIGVKVRPRGDLLISGRIGIPEPVTVFDQYPPPDRATRTLFSMPTVSVPLLGLSVGSTVVGVALTINGRVTGHAFVGPGRLTQTELRIVDFNPAEPDSLHITGDAEFHLPAEAGVGASLDAGVTLGAAIINATAGINVSAQAALRAEVRPHVDLDWRPDAGLHLHADLAASLSPRLAFDVNGFAEVTANAFVTTFSLWRKDWNLAHREIGSSLALRLNAPVDYYSDGRGLVFDPQRVSFEVPSLDGDTLAQLMNDEGGSERAERAADAPRGTEAAGR